MNTERIGLQKYSASVRRVKPACLHNHNAEKPLSMYRGDVPVPHRKAQYLASRNGKTADRGSELPQIVRTAQKAPMVDRIKI